VSALLGYGWIDHTAYWAWVAGMAMGGGMGTLLGRWLVWLTLRNPLACLFRAYRQLFADIRNLWRTGTWS
jgi:hypothetical protein